jgi:DNA-binding NarL/FixJ family response regulator
VLPDAVAQAHSVRMSPPAQDHILVIDDEPVVCESLAVYLSDSGFKINTASSGDEGLALFRNTKPDLVICDLRMPLVDGLDVLKAINSESPETPVIVVSGQGSMNDVVTALRNGAVDYLFKPLIEMEVLEHSVRRALERGHLLKQNRQILEQLELTNAELERSLDLLEEDQEAGRRVQLRMLPPTPHVFNEYLSVQPSHHSLAVPVGRLCRLLPHRPGSHRVLSGRRFRSWRFQRVCHGVPENPDQPNPAPLREAGRGECAVAGALDA